MRTYLQSLKALFVLSCVGLFFVPGCRHREWDISDLKITGILPNCDGGRISVNARITVSFNKKIDRASAQILVYNSNIPVPGKLTFEDTSITFTPSANFDANTDYTWIVPDTVRDENGGGLAEESEKTCRTEDGVDTVPPVTTPTLAEGVFTTAQSVVLTCTDNFSGCDKIIYTTNGSIPTLTNGTVTNGNATFAIPLGMGDNTVRYTAIDKAGNIAPYYEARYAVSTTGYLVVGTASHFARGIGARPGHFEAFHSGMDQSHVFRDPVTQLLYVAAGDGLYISNTNGATYTRRAITGSSVFADRQRIFMATFSGVAISTDGGNSFTITGESAGLFHDGVNSIAIDGNRVYATGGVYYVAQSQYVGGLAISTDGGNSFIIKTSVHGLGSNGVFKIFADGSRLYMTTAAGLTISPDGGNTFLNLTMAHGLGSNEINAIYASGMDVYAATTAGLSISHDGGNTFVNRTQANGLPSSSVRAIYGFNSKIYAAFTSGVGMYSSVGVGASSDGGLTFQNYGVAQGHLGVSVTSIFADQSAVYVSTGLGLMKSTNSGQNYTHDLNHLGHRQVENGIAVSGSHLYAGTIFGVSYSQNGGAAFQTLHKGQGLDYASIGYVQDVKIAGGKVFVAMTNGLAVAPVGVHNFQVKTTAQGLGHNYVTKLYADGNTLYALTGIQMSKTSDGGNSFSLITLPSSSATMNLWVSGNEILIITENEGIYRSIDGGTNWTTFDDSNGWIFSMNGQYVPWGIFKEGSKIYYGTELGLFVSNDSGGYFDLATGYTIFANSIRNILVRDSILYMGAYNSNAPDPMAPYENILNWSADRIIYGTSPNQEQELGGMAVYGIERYLNPNGDG